MQLSPTLITFLCIVAWPALTGLVNAGFHLFTPSDVDAWAERNPFVAKVAAFARRLGFEPVAMLTLIAGWFATNPPPPSVISGNVAMGKKRGFADIRAIACIALAALFTVACAGFWTPARQSAAEKFASCVVLHSALLVVDGDMSPEQEAIVAQQCLSTPNAVHDFIVGHPDEIAAGRAAVRKAEASKAGCPR